MGFRGLRCLALALLAVTSWSWPVAALRFYVNPATGDDRRSHMVVQDQATPWRTIAHAVRMAHLLSDGRPHVIDIAPGTYSPSTGETFPIVVSKTGIYFRSQGTVVFDAQRKSRIFEITAPTSDFVLNNFSLVNGLGEVGGAVYCLSCSLRVVESRLHNNESTRGGDALYVENGRLRLNNTSLRDNGAAGSKGAVVLVRNTFGDTTQRDVIRNNAFYENRTPAVLTAGNRTDISSNIFVGTAGSGVPAVIDSATGVQPLVRYNLFWKTDVLYLSAEHDSIKVARTVRDTVTLAEQGVDVPSFVTNVPDTVAKVGSLYEFDIQTQDSKSGYKFTVLNATDIPVGMSAADAQTGVLRWTPAATQVGKHAVRLEIIRQSPPPVAVAQLSYVITVFTAADFPDTTTPAPVIKVSTVPDTTRAIDSLNSVVPVFSTAASAGGNRYGNPLFLFQDPTTTNFDLLAFTVRSAGDTLFSVARDRGNPIVAMYDAVTFGGQKRNDMGRYGGPGNSGPPDPGTLAETKVTNLPDSLAVEGQVWTYNPTLDPSGNVIIVDLITSQVTPPPTLTQSLFGKKPPITWTPAIADTGEWFVGIQTFTTNVGSARHYFPLRVRAANEPPRVTSTPPSTATEDAPFTYALVAADVDGDAISFAVQSGPAGLTVDNLGVVRWTPAQADVGSVNVVIGLTDARGAPNTHAFGLQVANANDRPTLGARADTTAAEDALFQLALTATDPDPGDSLLTFGLGLAPAGATVDSAGVLRWTPAQADVGQRPVTVRVSDAAGARDSTTFRITVVQVDDPPSITSSPDTLALEDQAYAYAVTAVDEEGLPLTFSLVTAPASMAVDSTGAVRWTPGAADVGVHPVQLRAADPNGLPASQSYQLRVDAVNDPPVVVSRVPADTLVVLNPGQGVQLSLVATDEEGNPLTFQWLIDGIVRGTGTQFLHVPDSTSADTVTARILDGIDTTTARWIIDARAIARIHVATDTVHFGQVVLGDTASAVLDVANPGRTTLTISNLQVDNLAFTAQFGSAQVARGAATTLQLGFAPPARGVVGGEIRFATNDPDRTAVIIPLSGTGVVPSTAGLDLDPAEGDQSELRGAGRAGESVPVDVHVSQALDVVRYALEVAFDPGLLTFASFSTGAGEELNLLAAAGPPTAAVSQPASGTVRIEVSGAGSTGASGSGALGRFTFTIAEGAETGATAAVQLARVELLSVGQSTADVLPAAEAGAFEVASPLPGDFDGSGLVDFSDFFFFADLFGSSDARADFNHSGRVDFDDFFIFADAFGRSARPVPVVGEGIAGLVLAAPPQGPAGVVTAELIWTGREPLRGVALYLAFDARTLAFDRVVPAASETAPLTWSQLRGPGLLELALARPAGAADFDVALGAVGFRRLLPERAEVRVEAGLGHTAAGRTIDLAVPAPLTAAALPATAVLFPAHPNPFNPETVIPFFVPDRVDGGVTVTVYDLLGRSVRTLVAAPLEGGYHRAIWRGRDGAGREVGAGVYLVELRSGDLRQVRKVMLLK